VIKGKETSPHSLQTTSSAERVPRSPSGALKRLSKTLILRGGKKQKGKNFSPWVKKRKGDGDYLKRKNCNAIKKKEERGGERGPLDKA